MKLYLGLGETLPHKFHGKCFRRRASRRGNSGLESCSSEDEVPVSTVEEAKAEVVAESFHFAKYISSGLSSDVSGP